jgi:hypothetical protein
MTIKVILLHETVSESYKRDAGSFLLAFAIMAVATFLGSVVFQFIGGLVFLLMLFAAGSKHQRYSLDEAQQELDRIRAELEKKQ